MDGEKRFGFNGGGIEIKGTDAESEKIIKIAEIENKIAYLEDEKPNGWRSEKEELKKELKKIEDGNNTSELTEQSEAKIEKTEPKNIESVQEPEVKNEEPETMAREKTSEIELLTEELRTKIFEDLTVGELEEKIGKIDMYFKEVRIPDIKDEDLKTKIGDIKKELSGYNNVMKTILRKRRKEEKRKIEEAEKEKNNIEEAEETNVENVDDYFKDCKENRTKLRADVGGEKAFVVDSISEKGNIIRLKNTKVENTETSKKGKAKTSNVSKEYLYEINNIKASREDLANLEKTIEGNRNLFSDNELSSFEIEETVNDLLENNEDAREIDVSDYSAVIRALEIVEEIEKKWALVEDNFMKRVQQWKDSSSGGQIEVSSIFDGDKKTFLKNFGIEPTKENEERLSVLAVEMYGKLFNEKENLKMESQTENELENNKKETEKLRSLFDEGDHRDIIYSVMEKIGLEPEDYKDYDCRVISNKEDEFAEIVFTERKKSDKIFSIKVDFKNGTIEKKLEPIIQAELEPAENIATEKIIEWMDNKTYLRTKKWEKEPKFLIIDSRFDKNDVILEDKYGHQEFIGHEELYKLNNGEKIIKEDIKEKTTRTIDEEVEQPEIVEEIPTVETEEELVMVGEVVERLRRVGEATERLKRNLTKNIEELSEAEGGTLEKTGKEVEVGVGMVGVDQGEVGKVYVGKSALEMNQEELQKLQKERNMLVGNLRDSLELSQKALGSEYQALINEKMKVEKSEGLWKKKIGFIGKFKNMVFGKKIAEGEAAETPSWPPLETLISEMKSAEESAETTRRETQAEETPEAGEDQPQESQTREISNEDLLTTRAANWFKKIFSKEKKEIISEEGLNERIKNARFEDLEEVFNSMLKDFPVLDNEVNRTAFKASVLDNFENGNYEGIKNYSEQEIQDTADERTKDILINFFQKVYDIADKLEMGDRGTEGMVDIIGDSLPTETPEPVVNEVLSKETGKLNEDQKENIRKELSRMKKDDKKIFNDIGGLIDNFSRDERLFGDIFTEEWFNDYYNMKNMGIEYDKIKNIKTSDFIDTLREVYNEVMGEEDDKTKKEDKGKETVLETEWINKKDMEKEINAFLKKDELDIESVKSLGDLKNLLGSLETEVKNISKKKISDGLTYYGLRIIENKIEDNHFTYCLEGKGPLTIDPMDIKENFSKDRNLAKDFEIDSLKKYYLELLDKVEELYDDEMEKDNKETREVTEEMKGKIREGLEKLKKENDYFFKFIGSSNAMNNYLNFENSCEEDLLGDPFCDILEKDLNIKFKEIKDIKTKDFMTVLRETYDEVKKEK